MQMVHNGTVWSAEIQPKISVTRLVKAKQLSDQLRIRRLDDFLRHVVFLSP